MATYTALDIYKFTKNNDIDSLMLALNQEEYISEWHYGNRGYAAPHIAIINDNIDCLILLLNYNCDINLTAINRGETLLFLASAMGNLSIVKMLLKRGARNDHNSLFIACANNRTDVVRYLIHKGADFHIRENGLTSLLIAIHHHCFECFVYLIRKGADIEAIDFHGRRPLQIAALTGQAEMCAILLEEDAKIFNHEFYIPVPSQQGELPFDCRPMIEKERKRRGKLTMISAFDDFVRHHIEYQPYLDQINLKCYPLGHSKPMIKWKQAYKVRSKYYFDEILFYVHLFVAQVSTRSDKNCSDDTVIVASECISNFASSSNKTSTLMTVFASQLKEFLSAQKLCSVCSKECHATCTRCWTAFYCSDTCQKADWKEHKLTCKHVTRGSRRSQDNNNNIITLTEVDEITNEEVATTNVDL